MMYHAQRFAIRYSTAWPVVLLVDDVVFLLGSTL